MTRKRFAGFLALTVLLFGALKPSKAMDMSAMQNNSQSSPAPQATAAPKATPASESETDKAINQAAARIVKESLSCGKNNKVCGKGKATMEIADFICGNGFYSSCGKGQAGSQQARKRVSAAISNSLANDLTGKVKNPGFKDRDGKTLAPNVAAAELLVTIENPEKKNLLINACSGTKESVKKEQCQGFGTGETIDGWLSGFLVSASHDANAILWGNKLETGKSIDAHDQSSKTNLTGNASNVGSAQSAAVSKAFGWQDLYEGGAVSQLVRTKGSEGRQISIKLYTQRDPKTNQLIQQVGVFDYSHPGGAGSPSQIYGRRFSTGQNVDQSFTLTPDGPTFHLTINNGAVTFSKEGDKTPQMNTTIAALASLRLDQARQRGYEEKIGNQTFKVIGQGGANGTLLFFPYDPATGTLSSTPQAMAKVNEVGPDGYVHNLDSKPWETSLGNFPTGQDGADQFYYMKIAKEGNETYFEPTVCDDAVATNLGEKCDFPPPPPDPTTAKTPQAGDQSNAGQTAGNAPSTTPSGDGSCALSSKDFPNPPVWNGWTFFPGKNGISICLGAHQITASGILRDIKSENGVLGLTMAIPDTDSKIDPQKLYANLKPNWDYEVSCPDEKSAGGEKLPCSASFKGINFTKDERYFVPMAKIKNISSDSPISELIATRLEFDLNVKSGEINPSEAEISATTPEYAKKAWADFTGSNPSAHSYTKQVDAFIDSQVNAQKSKGSILIHPFSAEISDLGKNTPIVTGFNGEELTVADLLKGTTPEKPEGK